MVVVVELTGLEDWIERVGAGANRVELPVCDCVELTGLEDWIERVGAGINRGGRVMA